MIRNNKPSLAVFLGASNTSNPAIIAAAKQLGELIAQANIRLIYGGSNRGLMSDLAGSALQNGCEVIGVMPEFLQSTEGPHPGITHLSWVSSIAERIKAMTELADGIIVLPGGLGTTEELFVVWNHIKLGLYDKPLGILNIEDYYKFLLEYMQQMQAMQFVNTRAQNIPIIEKDIKTLFSKVIAKLQG